MPRTSSASRLSITPSPFTSPFPPQGSDASLPDSNWRMRAASLESTTPSQFTSPASPGGAGEAVAGGALVAVASAGAVAVASAGAVGVASAGAVAVASAVAVAWVVAVGMGVNVDMQLLQNRGGTGASCSPLRSLSGDAETNVPAINTAANVSAARPKNVIIRAGFTGYSLL